MNSLITTLLFPLLGMFIILFLPKENKRAIKNFALGTTIVTFLFSVIYLMLGFDATSSGFQFYFESVWMTSIDAGLRFGIDGMSLLLVMLTTFLMPIVVLSSFGAIEKREKEYYTMLMLLEFALIGVFASLDIFLFYIFWEIILIPMYFIIGIWGGKDRIYASIKFFIFTMVGSLFMLVAIIWLGKYVGTELLQNAQGFTTNFIVIRELSSQIPMDIQSWLFIAFALSFLIKVPIFPLHTWLPDAHTEAPTPGSVILAGVLLKMGTYGLIRFNLDLFPQASIQYGDIIATLAVIGIIYGALCAMVQKDIKRLVAYSSVSHLGFVVLGIFSMTAEGLQGAIIQMVNHGLSTGMLFLCVGCLYERRHTREISEYGGIARIMPQYAVFFAIAMFASVGLPLLNGFVGEFLTLVGAFTSPFYDNIVYAVLGTTGVIFAAVYLLWMWQRVMFGTCDHPKNQQLHDLNKREWAMLVPIVIFIVWIGIYPKSFMSFSENSTRALVNKLEMVKFGHSSYVLPEAGK
ncbi:MAG: NADH-quinone oxidoreductase subunit M [Ignavibacteria bacterium]|jgi:NADH-quinone oxidoreductase subunit M|nr:NADH-quinone oxidoreductase subunit M [Ignavibacteria bacterium]